MKYLGFSLVELMVVIAIIGLLSIATIPSYKNYVIKAQASQVYTIGQNALHKAAEAYNSGVVTGTGTGNAVTIDYGNLQYITQATYNIGPTTVSEPEGTIEVNFTLSNPADGGIDLYPTDEAQYFNLWWTAAPVNGAISWTCFVASSTADNVATDQVISNYFPECQNGV